MKRIHYLLLGLLVSLTIAAVSPSLPPTRLAAGANTTITTNGVNSFTIASSGGGSGAQLNGTNVFTGTNTFSSFALSAGGDSGWTNLRAFYRATGSQYRTLLATNFGSILFFNAATNIAPPIQAGGYALCTPGFEVMLPALLGSNSVVEIQLAFYKTNATQSSFALFAYEGGATNLIAVAGSTNGIFTTAATDNRFPLFNPLFFTLKNANSYSMQVPTSLNGSSSFQDAPVSLFNSAVPWRLLIGFTSTLGATNVGFYSMNIQERVLSP